jgi:GDP/UDP-N,N'-diacetylbacillosamine 2-epimerase (hydrolysing)
MHLSPEFGMTCREIERDGFRIDRKVDMLLSSDSAAGTAKSLGLGVIGFADALADLAPDVMVVLGDRFEIFAAVSAALFAKIPVAHLHGGEITEGAYDDAMRHSITKMSHLHFVATEEYRNRVIQLGEQPDQVHLVGGLGVDAIHRIKLMEKAELESSLGFQFGKKNLLITFHPATLDGVPATQQMQALLQVLGSLDDTRLIFTLPNADTGGREMIRMLEEFVVRHENARAYPSLGQLRYLSCIAHVDGVVGNSSSGLLEAPTLKTGTVNIGDRQKGRPCAASVINCDPSVEAISGAIARLYSKEFKNSLVLTQNPYGEGGATEKIANILRQADLTGLSMKRFYNLSHCRPETKSD